MNKIPQFVCADETLTLAYKLAIGTVAENVNLCKAGFLREDRPCLMAGVDYPTPWTRDAAINIHNAAALLAPKVSKNTLLSVLKKQNGKTLIGGEYWDKIIWAIGVKKYLEFKDDAPFLKLAAEALSNTFKELEENEFDSGLNLFRGGAVYGDGISAYPDKYKSPVFSCGIIDFPGEHPKERHPKGVGVPCFSLSTNCVYFKAYEILAEFKKKLGSENKAELLKAKKMKEAVNKHFYNEAKGTYDYLSGECDYQEGMGISFACLFGIADKEKSLSVIKNAVITNAGIPCVYPAFERYTKTGGYARHSGTVWPHIQGFFALAALKAGDADKFEFEFKTLAKHAVRDLQFTEIYHPDSGMPYGGMQEWREFPGEDRIGYWESRRCQTWSATAYLSMVYEGIFGMKLENGVLSVTPYLPQGIDKAGLKNLYIRGKKIDIEITRSGIGKTISVKLDSQSKKIKITF